MPNYIMPLSYQPGIRRDGTDFEPTYCRDGFWVRFNEGQVKKIGGMVSAAPFRIAEDDLTDSPMTDLRIFPHLGNSDKAIVFVAGSNFFIRYILNSEFNARESNNSFVIPGLNAETTLFQSVVITRNNIMTLVYLVTDTVKNISDATQGTLFHIDNLTGAMSADNVTFVDKDSYSSCISGGLVYAAPFLFLYGDNGLVQYSSRLDPFVFTNAGERSRDGSGSLSIGDDKVIYGTSIRGGSNSPSLLFWTLSTVVRIINRPTADDPVFFHVDVVSQSSSIMSSRSVVEYDGLFFWPGTDQFYHYNGVVESMAEHHSLNFFFDNVDMSNRQLVFGVKNIRYGEIWWFYPETGQDANDVYVTRALIFHKQSGAWYDTPIHRSAGFYSDHFGFMATFGHHLPKDNFLPPLDSDFTRPSPERKDLVAIWRHEVGVDEVFISGDEAETNVINSYVETPVISISAFNTSSPTMGVDNFLNVRHLEPDFVYDNVRDEMGFRVIQSRYAQGEETITPALDQPPYIFNGNTEKVDLRIQARNLRFRFESNKNFKLGNIMLSVSIGDGN